MMDGQVLNSSWNIDQLRKFYVWVGARWVPTNYLYSQSTLKIHVFPYLRLSRAPSSKPQHTRKLDLQFSTTIYKGTKGLVTWLLGDARVHDRRSGKNMRVDSRNVHLRVRHQGTHECTKKKTVSLTKSSQATQSGAGPGKPRKDCSWQVETNVLRKQKHTT